MAANAPTELLKQYNLEPANFNEYEVMPRLLFGKYLEAQFDLLRQQAKKRGIGVQVMYNTSVTDVADLPATNEVKVITETRGTMLFDVCNVTGRHWKKRNEGIVANWFDSPYPPEKLLKRINFPVAVKGSSLTAIDAVSNTGSLQREFYSKRRPHLHLHTFSGQRKLRICMFSLGGYLPGLRFHLADTHLTTFDPITEENVPR